MSFTADISKSVRREVYGLKNVPKVRCRYGIRMLPMDQKQFESQNLPTCMLQSIVISKLMSETDSWVT